MLQLPEHERQGIPHHLLDVADPADDFSAGQFFREARTVTEEILQVCMLFNLPAGPPGGLPHVNTHH